MRLVRATVVGVSALIGGQCLAQEDKSVENAFKVCFVLDKSGLLTEECKVSGWNSTVTAKADINSGQARQLCGTMVEAAKKQGWNFNPRWQLNIYSPYSGNSTIAFCKLT